MAILGTMVFLASLIAAGAGALDYQLNAIDLEGNLQEIGVTGMVVASLVVLASAFVGGWVAARMARFDGVINATAAALWLLLLVAVFAALGAFVGAEYNAFQRAGLPDWFAQFDAEDITTTVVIAGLVGIIALFVGAALGGMVGDRYNQRVNAALAERPVVGG